MIHRLHNIFSANVKVEMPDGRWAAAVAEPYTSGRLNAAWAVLTGRAYALRWPKPGEIEASLFPAGREALRAKGGDDGR